MIRNWVIFFYFASLTTFAKDHFIFQIDQIKSINIKTTALLLEGKIKLTNKSNKGSLYHLPTKIRIFHSSYNSIAYNMFLSNCLKVALEAQKSQNKLIIIKEGSYSINDLIKNKEIKFHVDNVDCKIVI